MESKLKKYRVSQNISQKEIAKLVSMDQTTYSKKENGKSPIIDEEWERFAKALGISVEEIKETIEPVSIKNENCTFNENSVGIQYVNIPQNVFDIIIKYNAKLENDDQLKNLEIERLRDEIAILKNK